MKFIIYCASWEKGEAQFDKIMQHDPSNMKITKKKRGSFAINIFNKNSYEVVYAFDGARGHKWNMCWVDEDISLAVYRNIILPSSLILPAERWVYFY